MSTGGIYRYCSLSSEIHFLSQIEFLNSLLL